MGSRALPASTVDTLHEATLIYADARGHAVYPLREGGIVVSAMLERRGYVGWAVASRRDGGTYRYVLGDLREGGVVVVGLTPIEALAAQALLAPAGPALVCATGGARPYWPDIDTAVRRGVPVRVALDRARGDAHRLWVAVRARYPDPAAAGIVRAEPRSSAWTGDLLAAARRTTAPPDREPAPSRPGRDDRRAGRDTGGRR